MQQSRSYGGLYAPSWTKVDQTALVASVGSNAEVGLPIDEFALSQLNVPWARFTAINGTLLLDKGFYTLTTQLQFSYATDVCQLVLHIGSWQGWIDVQDSLSVASPAPGVTVTTVAGFIDVDDPLTFNVHVALNSAVTGLQGTITVLKHA